MSTRAMIIIQEDLERLYYYRHNDGYPECVLSDLKKIMDYVRNKHIQSEISDIAYWLQIIGHVENYINNDPTICNQNKEILGYYRPVSNKIHGIQYEYIFDIKLMAITYYKVNAITGEIEGKKNYFLLK